MKSADASTSLRNKIIELEAEILTDEQDLKASLKNAVQSLKPATLIKNTIKDIITAPELKDNLANALIGLATGFVTRKIFVGGSHNPIRKILGKLTEITVANKVGKNADGIRTLGGLLLKKLLHKNGQT